MIRVALVHDWLTGMRGGEYVLEAIAELFPKAEIFTLLAVPGSVSPILTTLKRHTSWLQKVPSAPKRYRSFLPLMPQMIEQFDLTGFDLILSSSHCVAKGIQKPPGAVHVSYVHAPMRYMWDRFEDYFAADRSSRVVRTAAQFVRSRMQKWDYRVSQADRVDVLIANSKFIADKIQKAYGRESSVVYPFALLDRFTRERQTKSFYLMVTAFAPYKRVDLAIEAFNRLKKPLYIVGKGQEEARLKKQAGPTIEFLGPVSNTVIDDLYSKAKAFVFPGVEDFGITPLEAMASGCPVIAYGEGGACETVTEKTGILFHEQTVEALCSAVEELESRATPIDPQECRKQARSFGRERFQEEYLEVVRRAWREAGKNSEDLEELIRSGWYRKEALRERYDKQKEMSSRPELL